MPKSASRPFEVGAVPRRIPSPGDGAELDKPQQLKKPVAVMNWLKTLMIPVGASLLLACGTDEPLSDSPKSIGSGGSANLDAQVDTKPFVDAREAAADGAVDSPSKADAQATLVPNFALEDKNATSLSYQQKVSPRDYLGQVSAWYFGHAT